MCSLMRTVIIIRLHAFPNFGIGSFTSPGRVRRKFLKKYLRSRKLETTILQTG